MNENWHDKKLYFIDSLRITYNSKLFIFLLSLVVLHLIPDENVGLKVCLGLRETVPQRKMRCTACC